MPPDHLLKHLPHRAGLIQRDGVPGIPLWLMEVDDRIQLSAADIQSWWSDMPYWAFAWAGGRAQAQWILDHPESVCGKKVLDFGCGSGLVAIAAAKAGAKSVCAIDIDPVALRAVLENAALNSVAVDVAEDWTGVQADCFFASDVLYDPASHATLVQLMENCPQGWLAEPALAIKTASIRPDNIRVGHVIATPCSSTLPEIGDFDCAVDIEILPVGRHIRGC
ncbi:MAG: methyltransferase [Oceanospirillaceae bacterium]|nr:methyltransferase [Oceanospirillaceae bacterium]